jgi:hypothetical protein
MADGEVYATHGLKLFEKTATATADEGLTKALSAYREWVTRTLAVRGRAEEDIRLLAQYLNEYKDISEPIFDARPNSAQEVLQPSIIEEFMGYLFAPLAAGRPQLVLRPDRGFINLVFHPRDLDALEAQPQFTISGKDHDFVIGGQLALRVVGANGAEENRRVVVPAVAIECKRYLERNMLDECAGTAARLKRATPYCLYLVVSEYLKMDNARPELSRIDEIYILRKQRNSDRLGRNFVPNPIDGVLVADLYQTVQRHLARSWWDPESALTRGKVFDF